MVSEGDYDNEVFHEAQLPECTPHIEGISEVMRRYIDAATASDDTKNDLYEGIDNWSRQATQGVVSPGKAGWLYRSFVPEGNRISSYTRLDLSQSPNTIERGLNRTAAKIIASYDISRVAAKRVDDAYGHPTGELAVTIPSDIKPDQYLNNKLSITLPGRNNKRIPLTELFAAAKEFNRQADEELAIVKDEYDSQGISFDTEKTKDALGNITYLRTHELSQEEKMAVADFRKEAINMVIHQQFEELDEAFSALILEIPKSTGVVIQNRIGLTKNDISDLATYAKHENEIREEEIQLHNLKKEFGNYLAGIVQRPELIKEADAWVTEHKKSFEESRWYMLKADGDYTEMRTNGVGKNGHSQIGISYQLAENRKGHVRAVAFKKLYDLGIITDVRPKEGSIAQDNPERYGKGSISDISNYLSEMLRLRPLEFSTISRDELLRRRSE